CPSAFSHPPQTAKPLGFLLSAGRGAVLAPMKTSEASILPHPPPPVTYRSVLPPTQPQPLKPSRPRAVTSQRSWVCEIQLALPLPRKGTRPTSKFWPSLLLAEPSPSKPMTHMPACYLQPPRNPPRNPETTPPPAPPLPP